MAEVLITLGIIGIVAALTIPNLIANYKKHEVETKLKRFYSTMNQAIVRAEIDKGNKKDWDYSCSNADSEECLIKFYDNYYKPYIKTIKTEYIDDKFIIYFADGSVVRMSYGGRDYTYYLNKKYIGNYTHGKTGFMFAFYTYNASGLRRQYFEGKGIEPYISSNWDGTREGLKKIPNSYVKLIQLNGWKIPDDYPIKF